MLGSAAIELAIGLVVLYILLSSVCSAACEFIMHVFRPRSGLLRTALGALFAAPAGSAPPNSVVGFILNHGMFRTLPGEKKPSYIPARSFAAAVVDGLIPDTAAAKPTPPAVADLRKTAAELPESPARDALLAIFDRVGENLTRATEEIEAWYADAMDRVGGIYKRNVQLVLFIVGIALAAAINADSIMVARALSTDKELRTAIGTEALALAKAGSPTIEDPGEKLRKAQEALAGSALPLGWSSVAGDARALPWNGPPGSGAFLPTLCKALGLLITAAAVSFGAPFWFDVLNHVTNLRASGPKPKRPEEEKEDEKKK